MFRQPSEAAEWLSHSVAERLPSLILLWFLAVNCNVLRRILLEHVIFNHGLWPIFRVKPRLFLSGKQGVSSAGRVVIYSM